jgi:hypothetical protein
VYAVVLRCAPPLEGIAARHCAAGGAAAVWQMTRLTGVVVFHCQQASEKTP